MPEYQWEKGLATAPVLNSKSWNTSHVIEVGRDERGIERERMCRDRGIEILEPRAPAFQCCLDAAVRLADGVGPFGSWKL